MANLGACATVALPMRSILKSTTNCSNKGGIKSLFVTSQPKLDLNAMALAANFSTTGADGCGSLTNYVMASGGLFVEFENSGGATNFKSSKQSNGN